MKLGKNQTKVNKGQAQELEQMFKEVEEVMDQFNSMKKDLKKALKAARLELDEISE